MNEVSDTNKMISELITSSRMLGFYIGLMTGIIGTLGLMIVMGKF